MFHRRDHTLILAAAAIGVAARLAFGLLYWVDKPLTHDEVEYLTLAANLSAGRGFTYDRDTSRQPGEVPPQQFGRAPGYPAFLSLIGAGRGSSHSPVRVKVAQAVLGGVTVWLIGVLALDAAGARAGITAAALAAAYPPLIWISAYVFSEGLYSVSALLTVLLLQRAMSPRSPRGLELRSSGHDRRATMLTIGAGLLAGLAILIRPVMALFVPLAAIWLIRRREVQLAILMAFTTLMMVVPWTVRNAYVHGRIIPVASEGGVTFWTGNHPLARGEGDLAANPELEAANLEFQQAHPGLSSEDLEPFYYRDALQWIATEPLNWFALLLRKLFYTVVPVGPSYALHSTKYWAVSLISYLLVLPFAIMGLKRLWRDERRPTALLLLAASAVLASLIFFPQERFRIPVIDPALIVLASAWLSIERTEIR